MNSIGERTRRRIRAFLTLTIAGTIIGIGFGSLIGFAGWGQAVIGGLIGSIHGFSIAACIGVFEIFAVHTALGKKVERAPFAVTLFVKGLLYSTVISAVELGEIGERIIRGGVSEPIIESSLWPLSIAFSFVFTFTFIFVLQVSRLVGAQTLRDLVLGRYHHPRVEERFFLFVDLSNSTGIAERLGPLSIHRLLNRVFSLTDGSIADQHGTIYQYVGDEIVITWKVAEGRISARPVACFFAIKKALLTNAVGFERDFGVVPAVHGAIHAGTVVAGEVGESKREIVFHGDVMNAAARLEKATQEIGCEMLASKEAYRRLLDSKSYDFNELGPRLLRGRQDPIQVFTMKEKEIRPIGRSSNANER